MADTTIRWTFAKALLEVLREMRGLKGVQVEFGWPGVERLENRYVYLAKDNGSIDIPVMHGDPDDTDVLISRRDEFSFLLVTGAIVPGDDLAAAKEACEAINAIVELCVAAHPTVNALDGLQFCHVSDKEGSTSVVKEGAWSTSLLTITARADYRGPVPT